MKYRQFIFESYIFDRSAGKLELRYSLDGSVTFTEQYLFDFPFSEYNPEALDRALQMLFLMAGISYYKTFIPPEIILKNLQLDKSAANFFSKTYKRGLGEFWYVNQLDPRTPVRFPTADSETLNTLSINGEGSLVGLGGGKDSLVSTELLAEQMDTAATWSLNHRPQLAPLAARTGLPHYWVERHWDAKLKNLAAEGAYNGHVPISAILACAGVVAAILAGKRNVITSNESSANEATLTYQGLAINHQYSKSLEFEQDFQAQLKRLFGDSLRYFSFLRPLSELNISEIFAAQYFEKYKDVFSSCNRAFVHTSSSMSWCGECPKCAFTFLALTPFLAREQLESLFKGKNLLLEPSLEPVYRQLLGIDGDKPLECVGEIQESRAAMHHAQKQYPELGKYEFKLDGEYNFRTHAEHSMPLEFYSILETVTV